MLQDGEQVGDPVRDQQQRTGAVVYQTLLCEVEGEEKKKEGLNVRPRAQVDTAKTVLLDRERVTASPTRVNGATGLTTSEYLGTVPRQNTAIDKTISSTISLTSKSAWAGPREEMFSFNNAFSSCASISDAPPGAHLSRAGQSDERHGNRIRATRQDTQHKVQRHTRTYQR